MAAASSSLVSRCGSAVPNLRQTLIVKSSKFLLLKRSSRISAFPQLKLRIRRTGLGFVRSDRIQAKATPSEDSDSDASQKVLDFFNDLRNKWDGVENKSNVILYASGALVTLWFSSAVVNAMSSVPLLPKAMELVGLGYTSWFVYRYLLFKSNREELLADVEELKEKITGSKKD